MDPNTEEVSCADESTDLPEPRTFHRFMELPLEIRHMVYCEYLGDNDRTVFSQEWPEIELIYYRGSKPCPGFTPAEHPELPKSYFDEGLPILPAICFLNRTVGAEVARFFLTIATFKVTTSDVEDLNFPFYLDKYATLLRTIGVSLGDHIHHLVFPGFNGTEGSETIENDVNNVSRDYSQNDPALRRAKKCNAANSQLLLWSYFRKVQRLEIVFFAPTVADDWVWPINDFLQNFAPKSISRLAELRSVAIVAKPANSEEVGRYPHDSVDEEKFDHPQAAVGLARQFKDGFKADDRKVAVQVRLRHIRKCEERFLEYHKDAVHNVDYGTAVALGRSCIDKV